MREARGRDPKSRPARARHDDLGERRRRQIEIPGRLAKHEIADRAAGDASLLALAVERRQNARERALAQHARIAKTPIDDRGRAVHWKCPGAITPFSICAGT